MGPRDPKHLRQLVGQLEKRHGPIVHEWRGDEINWTNGTLTDTIIMTMKDGTGAKLSRRNGTWKKETEE